MQWNLEGLGIRAFYLGYADSECFAVVLSSRVKYGGKIQHRCSLVKPLAFLNEVKQVGDTVLIDHEEVQQVYSNISLS